MWFLTLNSNHSNQIYQGSITYEYLFKKLHEIAVMELNHLDNLVTPLFDFGRHSFDGVRAEELPGLMGLSIFWSDHQDEDGFSF